jgi:hypothetical protein
MNDVYHQELERWGRHQRDQLHDRFDDRNHPMAHMVYKNMQEIEDMAQQRHNLRTIHDKMQATQRILDQARRAGNPFMNADHNMELYHNLEHKKNEIRKHPDYN